MKTQLLPFALAALSFSGPGAGAARPLHALRRLGVSRARLVGTAAGAPLPSQRGDQSDDEQLGSAVESSQSADGKLASALYKFSRPHTIRGTVLASFAGVARALIEHPGAISLTLVPQALLGLLALGLGNVWIVGVNQASRARGAPAVGRVCAMYLVRDRDRAPGERLPHARSPPDPTRARPIRPSARVASLSLARAPADLRRGR